MEIRDGVYTYALDWPLATELGVNRRGHGNEESLSVNVVETDEGAVQIGMGHSTTADESVAVARRHGVDLAFAEHGDWDHYSAGPRLREELGVELGVPEGDAEAIADDGVEADFLLSGGDEIRGIEVIDAPGHTPGNLVFLYADVLFAGDTVLGADIENIADDDWSGRLALSPPNRNAGGDEAAIESVRKLLEYDFEVLLLTHGEDVLSDAKTEVEALVDDLDRGIDRGDRGALE